MSLRWLGWCFVLSLCLSFNAGPFCSAQDAPAANSGQLRTAVRLSPAEHGVGRLIEDVQWSAIDGSSSRLSQLFAQGPVAFVMTSTSCPLSLKYHPTLESLIEQYADRGVQFVVVAPVESDTPQELAELGNRMSRAVGIVRDEEGALAGVLGAESTTDVVVVDRSRTVVYHGAVDDQYGIGVALDEPRNRWLASALDRLLQGERPWVEATFAPGCVLETPDATVGTTDVTYHNQIARLMQRHCVSCHREQGAGPFPLDSYRDVLAHAPMIRQVVQQGLMPPWFAHEETTHGVSPWINDASLSEADKQTLLSWIDSDRPLGDPADAPAPLSFSGAWTIGEPDAVFEFAEPVAVKASGTMPYQNVRVSTNLGEDRWVQAIEVMPGVRDVVHHVLVFVIDPADEASGRAGRRGRFADADDETGGFWAAYVPGNSSLIYPDGYAKRLPKNAILRFQMHYTPMGRAVEDRTKIGIVFADQPPKHEVKVHGLANIRLKIEPGEANHQADAELRLPRDFQVLGFMPHMHLRGKACRYQIESASGVETLLDIPRYDFNWQLLYRYAEPRVIRRGETLRFIAWFDNSADNPANPNPNQLVRWGPQTTDEMLLGYVEYIEMNGASSSDETAGSRSPSSEEPAAPTRAQRLVLTRAFEQLDRNADRALSLEEFERAGERFPRLQRFAQGAATIFGQADRNQDQTLDLDEFMEAGARLLSRIER